MIKIRINILKKPAKIQIPKIIRLPIITILALILLATLFTTQQAYQTPAQTTTTKTVATYAQTSYYTYRIHLKNNTLYQTPILMPGQGKYFKQIIDNITASITYTYQSSLPGPINATYSLTAEITTDLWTKTYPLTTQTPFNKNNLTTSFTHEFPIDYSFYDTIVAQINTETGITAPNPLLIIRTNILITQTTSQGIIRAQFAPELSMTLTQKTLEFSDELSSTTSGTLTQPTTIINQQILDQRNLFTILTLLITLLLIIFFVITKNQNITETKTETIIKKIYKKHGEWIMKTTTPPPTTLQHTIQLATIDDLIKIGEELNKPLFHYQEPNPNHHSFYILDTTTTYIFTITTNKTLKP